MNKKIILVVSIIILLLVVLALGIYLYLAKKTFNLPFVKTPEAEQPQQPTGPLKDFEKKFFCYNFDPASQQAGPDGDYFYKEYVRRIYECVGYVDVNQCEANRNKLEQVKLEDVAGTISTCQDNSNGIKFLQTQDENYLNNIQHADLKQTYLAISRNDQTLCPTNFPFCKLVFTSSCYTDEDLNSNANLLLDFARQNSYIDPVYSFIGRESELATLTAEVNQNKSLICGVLDKENKVILKQATSCDQLAQENNLLERASYLRCSNIIQSEKNFCLLELDRLTEGEVKAYINNKCGYQ